MLINGAVERIFVVRAVAGVFVFFACCFGIAGVVFVARATRPLLRARWVTEVAKPDGSRNLPPAPAVQKTDVYWAGATLTLAVLSFLAGMILIPN